MDLRILTLLPNIYRRWASLRLADLAPWIEGWNLDEIFAGVPGRGAEHAWYNTSILTEFLRTLEVHYTGAAADIWKCFDQVLRPLVYDILLAAGFPKHILHVYMSCIEQLTIRNVIMGHIGQPHKHRHGIPQGCPFSMMILALLMRP